MVWTARLVSRARLSAHCVEQLLAVFEVIERFAKDFASEDTALAALAGHPEIVAQLAHGACPILYRRADLGIGNAFADTNVHGFFLIGPAGRQQIQCIANENDCQHYYCLLMRCALGCVPAD